MEHTPQQSSSRKRDRWRSWLQTPASARTSRSTSPLTTTPTSTPKRPTSSSPSLPVPLGTNQVAQFTRSSTSCSALDILGRDILEKALELLDTKDRAIIDEQINSSTDGAAQALEKALTAAQTKQAECDAKSWTFVLAGRTLKLKDEAGKVIAWLQRFKQVGDIAVNADPLHAGLPWALIRFLLEVPSVPF